MTPRRHIALGLLFLSALGILSYYTLFQTDVSLFEERQRIVAFAEDARGLRKGAPVLYAGVRWGKVEAVAPDLDRPREERVRIDVSLDQPIVLYGDHVVRIESASVLGGVQLSIDPGSRGAGEVDATGSLKAGSTPDVLAALGDLVEENRGPIRQAISGIEEVVASLNASEGTFGRLLNDPETADAVTGAVKSAEGVFDNLQALTDELRGGQGTLGKLIYDEELYRDVEEFIRGLDDAVANINQVVTDAREGQGLLATIIYDEGVAQGVRETVESVRSATAKIDEGDGAIARLINDGTIADDFQAALRGFTSQDSTIGRLMTDTEVYDNVVQLSADLADAGTALREERGTLGILLNDDTIARDVERAVAVLTGGLEEQREAAPIATFLSTVFLGF